jgi:GNAT superfamily N-acetyltransferase
MTHPSCRVGAAFAHAYDRLVDFEDVVVRAALDTDGDISVIDTFIRDLAKEEGLPTATATRDDLVAALFGENSIAHALIAEVDVQPAGFALYYPKYSTVTGRRGLHLEDIYVTPQKRGHHVGRAIIARLLELAGPAGMVEWWVMHSNADAILPAARRQGTRRHRRTASRPPLRRPSFAKDGPVQRGELGKPTLSPPAAPGQTASRSPVGYRTQRSMVPVPRLTPRPGAPVLPSNLPGGAGLGVVELVSIDRNDLVTILQCGSLGTAIRVFDSKSTEWFWSLILAFGARRKLFSVPTRFW